ncbi:tyrosine-type recombinase/integrase [Agrobacterium rosae]|uniref:tyrosine-type recombinase/integrase n=1 Tax=Agrobacterium rosae TaxID=1972867 RepID=UPI002A1408E4|nr:site-specific integrase [Agrobacterium rosae]MDX8314422.1 site-specific integrase [Agrobacterium rosae]
MRKKLTPKLLDNLPPAEGKRYEVRDELVTGLHIRISNAGEGLVLATRVDAVSRRIKLGTYPVLSLKDAREQAQMLLRDIQLGTFKQHDVEPAPKVLTLGDVIPQFITRYAQRHTKDWKGTESVLQRMSGLHGMAINAIKRVDVVRELERLISDIGENGGKGTRANRGLAAIKKLYSWCVDQGIVEISPVVGLKPLIKEVSRDRFLTDDEIIAYWNGCEAEGYPFEQFGKLLLLTGQRRDEIASMRWSEIDMHRGTLTLKAERTKNGSAHIVPLSRQALDILRSIPRFLGSDYVFTSTGKTPISGFGRFKDRIDTFVGINAEDWRFHDVRRTAATNMAILKVQPHIIEAVLNHKSGIVSGVASIYNRHAYFDEKREALQIWADSVEKLAAMTHLETSAKKKSELYLVS